MPSTKKALFLDRDGIINEDKFYVHRKEDVVFIEEIFNLCRIALKKDYLIIVVTNQAGVARGYYDENTVVKLHEWMAKEFKLRGIKITDFFYCPYHFKGTVAEYARMSDCRKPEPGMFLKAAKKYGIDFSRSLMIGDKPSDRIKIPQLKSLVVKGPYSLGDYDVETLSDCIAYLS